MTSDVANAADPSTLMTTDTAWDQILEDAEHNVADLEDRIHDRRSENRRVQIACDDAELVVRFVARSLQTDDLAAEIIAAIRQDKAYVEAVDIIGSTVSDFCSCLDAIDDVGPEDGLVEKLAGLASDLRQGLDEATKVFTAAVKARTTHDPDLSEERRSALRVASEIRIQLGARRFVHEAEQAKRQDQQAWENERRTRDETKKVAGKLGDFYETYADGEARSANMLRWIVAGLLATVAGSAFGLNAWLGSAALGTELVRLSSTIPVAVLAGYFARESSKHRASAKWARQLAIAMRTLPDYTEPLDDLGLELRRALGMRVFGSAADPSAAHGEDGLHDGFVKAVDQLKELVHRALETFERRTNSQ